jgi:hypothetical protein
MTTLKKTEDFERVTADIGAKAKTANLSHSWRALTLDERAVLVRQLMEVGHSNATCAKALGITPGQVAGVRWLRDIPSRNPITGGRKK